MSRTVISAPAETPVVETRALMLRERIRHLLVVSGGRLEGIDTPRDAREAARIMIDHKIGALPVPDGERLVNITVIDVRAIWGGLRETPREVDEARGRRPA